VAPTHTPPSTETPLPTDLLESTGDPTPASEVGRVVSGSDGDTIELQAGDTTYAVRYIGIDCPEQKHPESSVAAPGRKATAANEALVAGKTAQLEREQVDTDRVGQLLRYVWIGDLMVHAELVRLVFANATEHPPLRKSVDLFTRRQLEAEEAQPGPWAPMPTPLLSPPLTGTLLLRRRSHPPVERKAEFVDIRNEGHQSQDLGGWNLRSEKRGDQDCPLGGVIAPIEALRSWSENADSGKGGYNCGHGSYIWNTGAKDPSVLLTSAGEEVSRYGRYWQ
jgi:endonuclease YncB( thermonuclease family)